MKPDKSLEFRSALITLKLLYNGDLAVMDQSGSLRKINVDTHKIIGGFKTNIKQERSWGNHMSVSASGKYSAIIIPHTNKAVVYDIEKKKLLYTISRHKGDVESVCVDDDDHYIVSGGTDGKTFVWSLDTGALAYSFPPHSDYVTALEINSIFIASASYDRVISVLNLTTMQTPVRLIGHTSVVIGMKLLKNMRMISVDKEGYMILWDLQTFKILQRFAKINDETSCFAVSSDERFVFVGTKSGNVCLYDIEKEKPLTRSYLKEKSTITSLSFLGPKAQLVVGTKTGRVNFYALIPDKNTLMQMLKQKEYDKLYKAAHENPLLYYSTIYIKLEELWEVTLKKAVKMLENGQTTNYKAILEHFFKVPSKRMIIQDLEKDYTDFEKFKFYVNEKKYSLAYSMANRFEHFKKSDLYHVMENEWHINFNKAKLYLMHKEGDEKVRSLLRNFKGISEKTILIQDLFQQRTAYLLFQKKLAQKDYVTIFSLLKKCPFIKEFDEYDKLLEYADDIYLKAHKALDENKYAELITYTSELIYFPEYQDEANKMRAYANAKEKFTKALQVEDLPLMYELIGKYTFLRELPEAKSLEQKWNKHLILAEKYASNADVTNVISILEDFFEIRAKFNSIAVIMQQAYISQLKRALRSNRSQYAVENSIKKYLSFFGTDEHIENYIESYIETSGSTFDISGLRKGSIKEFRPSMIISDIVK